MSDPETLEAFIKPSQAAELAGLSAATIRRLVQAGEFPPPVVLSLTRSGRHARVAYVQSEIQAWLKARIATGKRARGSSAPQTAVMRRDDGDDERAS